MTLTTKRIEVADALRGFALLGILLVHNIDHFDLSNAIKSESSLLFLLDQGLKQIVFFLFGGKAYAIFALLFGFSFYIQYDNCQKKGIPFSRRFAWRMLLLFCFGLVHVMFYSGEILSVYAVVGWLLIPFRKLSDRALTALAVLFMLEPWEVYRLVHACCNPNYAPGSQPLEYYAQAMRAARQDTTFWTTAQVNLTSGLTNAHLFAWYSGRYAQTVSLFLIGILIGRKRLFVESGQSGRFWKISWAASLAGFILLWVLKANQGNFGVSAAANVPLSIMMNMWSNFAFMLFLVSSFVLVWFHSHFRNIQSGLAPYGRMSLTNYVTSSIIGSLIYYEYGLGLFAHLGVFFSFLIGITIFVSQLLFSRWWLKTHRYGPFEWVWHRLTWMKFRM